MIDEKNANFDTTNIAVKLNGRRYSFWKSAVVHVAVGEFAREVTLNVSDNPAAASAAGELLMDSPISVICDDKTVLTGYLDEVSVNYTATTHSITIRARSKTCDLVDCSYDGDAQFNGQSARNTIREICRPFGIKVIWDCPDWTIGEMNANVGDTCAGIITEICKRGGVFYTDDENGNLIITNLKEKPSAATIYNRPSIMDSNVLSATAKFSSRDRFSEYTVESQDFAWDDDETAEFAYMAGGTVRDPGVKRYRPKIVIAQTNQDSEADTFSARLEYMSATAAAADFDYKINGWRDDTGAIWAGGTFVNLVDEFAHVDNKLIVKSADLSISYDGGRTTQLKLVYPNALIKNYEPKKHNRDPWYYNGREI